MTDKKENKKKDIKDFDKDVSKRLVQFIDRIKG